jgi:hypothetical protein
MNRKTKSTVDIVFDDESDSAIIRQQGFTCRIKRTEEGCIEFKSEKRNMEET